MKVNIVTDVLYPPPEYIGGYPYHKQLPPGSIQYAEYDGRTSVIFFTCPCGCGVIGGLPVAGQPGWTWNGSKEAPTCSPSIRLPSCGWHGYLTRGEWLKV